MAKGYHCGNWEMPGEVCRVQAQGLGCRAYRQDALDVEPDLVKHSLNEDQNGDHSIATPASLKEDLLIRLLLNHNKGLKRPYKD